MAFITTTADNISSGGAITGDLTIEGDLTVSGDNSGAYSEIVTDGLQITKDTDGEFVSLILVNESDAASTAGIISQRFDLEDTGGTAVDSGKILVGKEASFTATGSTQDSYMALHTSLNGTLAEKVRITSAGNVGSGATTPTSGAAIAKFIDLEIFDRKIKLSKEESTDLKASVKRLEEKDFDQEIDDVSEQIQINEKTTKQKKRSCKQTKRELSKLEEESLQLKIKIDSTPAELVDIDELQTSLAEKQTTIQDLISDNQSATKEIQEKKTFLTKVEGFKNSFDVEDFKNKKEIISENRGRLESLLNEVNIKNNDIENFNNKVKLLEEVPCGSEYSHCKFIKDAYSAQQSVDMFQVAVDRLDKQSSEIKGEIEKLNPEKVEEYINSYEQVIEKKNITESEISALSLTIEKNNNQIITFQLNIDRLNERLIKYEKNKEAIENLETLITSKSKADEDIINKNEELQICEEALLNLYKLHGSIEQQLEDLQNQKVELSSLREDLSAYDLFERCMHSNGIPYDIIKKKLPIINEEISKILTNIVNFEIFFEAIDKKLEIYIKHPRFDARPIELGSGAEKTIAAMAIRLALLGVSNLPKPDLFILDEPGTSLDEDNMEGFIRILTDMIKTQFKTVLLISHLDSLKDCVDTTIEIERKDGLAYVNQ